MAGSLDGSADDIQQELLSLLKHLNDTSPEGDLTDPGLGQATGAESDPDAGVQAEAEVVGPTTEELESFKELIQFDHVYFKPQAAKQASVENPAVVAAQKPACMKSAVSIIKPSVKAAAQKDSSPAPVPSPASPAEDASSEVTSDFLPLGEIDLTSTLEELIDLGSMLREDLVDSQCQGLQDSQSADCIAADSFSSVSEACSTSSSRKRKSSAIDTYSKPKSARKDPLATDSYSLFPGSDTFGLEASLSPSSLNSSVSESGYCSDSSVLGSPKSDVSGDLGVESASWEETFSELFPSLI